MSGIVEKALIFAKVCHDGDSSGHDFEHIRRVLTNAEKIAAETPEADVEIVRLAAILHDVDDYKLNNGEARADGFLREAGAADDVREKVLAVTNAIGFSKSGSRPQFEMIEQAVVSDADKLDAMGAVGVCRTVMYSAATGRKLFDEAEFPKENLTVF